jgi:vacuolar-type H+-ATPase catalytic subunit A/Vma1
LERNSEEEFSHQQPAISSSLLSGIQAVTITLNHFSAALVFSLFASIVFGITHRENTRDMVRYGAYCFVMFLGGVLVAGWVMWVLKR